ncbi:MAG: hypothetical protein ACOYEL_04075 [Saccharofermentanales bacterium]|jgi:hypothetical protein
MVDTNPKIHGLCNHYLERGQEDMEKKMYTKKLEEIKDNLSRRNIDRLEEAILSGNIEEALKLHHINVEKKTAFHHFAVRWVNQTLRNFKKHAPDEAIFQCMEDYALWCYPPCLHEWMEAFKKGDASYKDFPFEDFLENRATLWQALHDNGDQIWEEDDKKITFILDRCNSGGWLITECADEVQKLDSPDKRSYNKEGFQCYCLNCTTMWEFGWYKWFGWPLFIMNVPTISDNSGRCEMVMYKDPKDIPDSYYERTGLERKI